MSNTKFNLNIDREMLDKLWYVSDYYGRSMTGQLVYMVRMLIEEYEEKHGEIPTGRRKQNFKK